MDAREIAAWMTGKKVVPADAPNAELAKAAASGKPPVSKAFMQRMIDGFNRHYRLFRTESARAKHRFETSDWHGQQRGQRERIEFYALRVGETSRRLEREFNAGEQPMEVWQQVKLLYIGMLVDHKQPELAESFFNSVSTKLLDRTYFHNDFIFVRPATATDYIERDDTPATYRVYYPAADGLSFSLKRIVTNFQLQTPFAHLDDDLAKVEARLLEQFGDMRFEPNHQFQVLASLFFRNKAAYIIGKSINGNQEMPFVIPIIHNKNRELILDTVLFDNMHITVLFSFTRAYFMVDMDVPSAYVQFIRSILPRKPAGVSSTTWVVPLGGRAILS
jgi:isocitrate dehydrogenase kinase/phosphatase